MGNPAGFLGTRRYNLGWAWTVYNALQRKYPRGCKTLESVFALEPRNLAAFIANGDPFWPHFRELTKVVEKLPEVKINSFTLANRIRGYLAGWVAKLDNESLKKRIESYLVDRLIELDASVTFKEQTSKGGSPRGAPSGECLGEPTYQLFFDFEGGVYERMERRETKTKVESSEKTPIGGEVNQWDTRIATKKER